MLFKSVGEAFNHYRNAEIADMEKRAQEIGNIIDTDANADIESLNIELRGIKEARENIELRSTNPAQGLTILTGMTNEAGEAKTFGDDVLDSAEYRSAFFKNLLGQKMSVAEKAAFDTAAKLAEKRADAFTSTTEAAAVLPTQTLNEVVKKARVMGGLLPECRSFALPAKISIPVGTPSTKAKWHTEGADVEAEKVQPTSVTFDANEIIKIFSISAKARRMSIPAFESYLVDELKNCVLDCINDALINGTGSSQGMGLEKGVTWNEGNQVEYDAAPTYADVVKAVALLKRGYSAGAKWCMSNATLYTVFYGMVDGNKRPIFIQDPKAESIGKILGHEIIIDDNVPEGTAYLGNFSAYMAYDLPEGIVVEMSRESSFKKGLIDYRALAIADCRPIVPEAFVRLSKKASEAA